MLSYLNEDKAFFLIMKKHIFINYPKSKTLSNYFNKAPTHNHNQTKYRQAHIGVE